MIFLGSVNFPSPLASISDAISGRCALRDLEAQMISASYFPLRAPHFKRYIWPTALQIANLQAAIAHIHVQLSPLLW